MAGAGEERSASRQKNCAFGPYCRPRCIPRFTTCGSLAPLEEPTASVSACLHVLDALQLRKIFSVTPIFGVEFSVEDKQSDGKENFVPRQEARLRLFRPTSRRCGESCDVRTTCK